MIDGSFGLGTRVGSALFCVSRIVRRVDIVYRKGSVGMNLHNAFTGCKGEVIHFFLQINEAACFSCRLWIRRACRPSRY